MSGKNWEGGCFRYGRVTEQNGVIESADNGGDFGTSFI